MSDLAELLARVKAANGPDRALDLALATALVPDVIVLGRNDAGTANEPYTHWEYTGKIDDALALVTRLLPGWMVVNLCEWEADALRERGKWNCTLKLIGTQDDFSAPRGKCNHAPTAPLAILVALLSALTQEHSDHVHP